MSYLRTVQTTAEGIPFSGSMNTVLCDFRYAAPNKNTYLLIYDVIAASKTGKISKFAWYSSGGCTYTEDFPTRVPLTIRNI